MDKTYFLEKLSDINYRISIHPENANRRLASEVHQLLILPTEMVPIEYRDDFNNLIELIKETVMNLSVSGAVPRKLEYVNSKKSVEFIKLLIRIQDKLEYQNP